MRKKVRRGKKLMLEAAHRNGNHLNGGVVPLFQPDPTAPDQYLETFHSKVSLEPEKRLMLAVLQDAVSCFQKYLSARDQKGKALFREIEEWILERDSSRIFSFESICEALELNPRYVRQGLMRWKEKELRRQAETFHAEMESAGCC